jgi:S1-C subfamily serine protease
VTPLDWFIAAFTLGLALLGFVRGFIVGALSLAGLLGGAFLGTRLAPEVLEQGSASPWAPLFGLGGAVLGGALLAGGLGGVGERLRERVASAGGGALDGLLGALLSAAVALGMVWIVGAIVLHTPGTGALRGDIQRSAVLSRLNAVLPPSGPVLNALARFDPFPSVRGPSADVPAPRAAAVRDPDVRAASASVVRVLGTACGLAVSGSGWVAREGLVVTNAHVVAGQDDTTVQLGGEGPRLPAVAVAFDDRNDVAVLRVDGLRAPALALAQEPRSGTSGAILGFPRNGPFDVRAGRLGATRSVLSADAYGRTPVRRSVAALRGLVRPGNSGGPFVDADGRVATTVFAARLGEGPRGGYGVPNDIVRDALEGAAAPVQTGRCAAGG